MSTVTGRYTMGSPNFQEINPKTPEGQAIREAFTKHLPALKEWHMTHIELAALFEKARKQCPYYAVSPVGKGPDPRSVSVERYGHFMRLPLGNNTNRWCFDTDVHRDQFVIDYKDMGVSSEN